MNLSGMFGPAFKSQMAAVPEDPLEIIKRFDKNLLKPSARLLLDEAMNKYLTTHDPSQQMLKDANILAFRDEPVLILGETGTGKELIAEILHAGRAEKVTRQYQQMVSINCAGITPTLFESIAFGHKKGAFTGAFADEPGLIRLAAEGTAFFDEVGELPLEQQAKLLRVLQSRKVRPVGGTDEYSISCRFVFATNRDLAKMVEGGTFRADLYYRISTFVLRTYPLRDRPLDRELIARDICRQNGWPEEEIIGLPPEAFNKGNVRQLTNFLYRKFVLGKSNEEAVIDL